MHKFKKQVSIDAMPPAFTKAIKQAQDVANSLVGAVRKPVTELTPGGEQYVVPGAERPPVKKGQCSLW